jgi:hypothetical protein
MHGFGLNLASCFHGYGTVPTFDEPESPVIGSELIFTSSILRGRLIQLDFLDHGENEAFQDSLQTGQGMKTLLAIDGQNAGGNRDPASRFDVIL